MFGSGKLDDGSKNILVIYTFTCILTLLYSYQAGLLLGEEVLLTISKSSTVVLLLPRQSRGTPRKLFTKPFLQVTALLSLLCLFPKIHERYPGFMHDASP